MGGASGPAKKAEETKAPEAASLIGVNGVPIYVNPESVLYSNTEAETRLFPEEVIIGPDELTFVQSGTVLQVNGVPVYVNPESVLYQNTEASTNLFSEE